METWWLRYYGALVPHQFLIVDLVDWRLARIQMTVVEVDLMRFQRGEGGLRRLAVDEAAVFVEA